MVEDSLLSVGHCSCSEGGAVLQADGAAAGRDRPAGSAATAAAGGRHGAGMLGRQEVSIFHSACQQG